MLVVGSVHVPYFIKIYKYDKEGERVDDRPPEAVRIKIIIGKTLWSPWFIQKNSAP